MKFLADMGISPAVVRWLREMGHDAVHLHEQGLGRLPNHAVLEKARREKRIVLTHDLDFGELLSISKSPQPSVIIFRIRDMRPITVQRYLAVILARHADVLEDGVIASVTQRRVRVRRLPIL